MEDTKHAASAAAREEAGRASENLTQQINMENSGQGNGNSNENAGSIKKAGKQKPRQDGVDPSSLTRALPHAIGPEKSILSSLLKDPAKFTRFFNSEGITSEDFYHPSHQLLFGAILDMSEKGLEPDMVSLIQYLNDKGLLDRVGGPSYIADIWGHAVHDFHFEQHLALVKSKSITRSVIHKASELINQAYDDPSDSEQLVDSLLRTADKIKSKNENRTNNFKKLKESTIDLSEIKSATESYMSGDMVLGGDPFFLPGFKIDFRKHECTAWLGKSFHGKSQAVQNFVANLMTHGKRSLIASFEQPPEVTLSQIISAFTANENYSMCDDWNELYGYVTRHIKFFKAREKTSPKQLFKIFRQAYLSEGIDNFVIDNVMTLGVKRDDNAEQAEAADMVRMFVAEFPVHAHLVVHPRKQQNQNANIKNSDLVPGQDDIRGAAEWGDMPNNVIVVWRDRNKNSTMSEMDANNYTDEEVFNFWKSTPCGKFVVQKQRATGDTPIMPFWFHKETKKFMSMPSTPYPMYNEKPWI